MLLSPLIISYSIAEMKLMHGDELRLRYLGEMTKPWSGVGHVMKISDSILLYGFIFLAWDCWQNCL